VTSRFKYLQAYPESLLQQVQKISDGPGLGAWLLSRHPQAHGVRTDSTLYAYVMDLKMNSCAKPIPSTK